MNFRCDGQQSCVVTVDSNVFHDACPGTLKYLEAHYACRSMQQQAGQGGSGSKRGPPLPPWLFDANHNAVSVGGQTTVAATNQRRPWANRDHQRDVVAGVKPSVNGGTRLTTQSPAQNVDDERRMKSNASGTKDLSPDESTKRKPILVTEKVEGASPTVLSTTTTTSRRVPITTPKPTTKTSPTTTTTTTTTTVSMFDLTTVKVVENEVFRNGDKGSNVAKTSNRDDDDFGGVASSSPVTTFTIASKYEKEDFGKLFFVFLGRKKLSLGKRWREREPKKNT